MRGCGLREMSICVPRVIALRLQPATYATPLADLLGYLGFMVDMNMRIYVSSTKFRATELGHALPAQLASVHARALRTVSKQEHTVGG